MLNTFYSYLLIYFIFTLTGSVSPQKLLIDGLSGVDYLWIVMFLSAVWTLILTAPIHRKGSIDEQEI